jgi:hypothetical protein
LRRVLLAEREQISKPIHLCGFEKFERFDCLIHFESHLNRVIDRALIQLERLQRMRQNQPVPPSLKIELSH